MRKVIGTPAMGRAMQREAHFTLSEFATKLRSENIIEPASMTIGEFAAVSTLDPTQARRKILELLKLGTIRKTHKIAASGRRVPSYIEVAPAKKHHR